MNRLKSHSRQVSGKTSILWVTGDEEVMRYVYRHYGFGYWTAAFDVVLEKHGWLDFEKAFPEVLEDPHLLRNYDLLIISWLPPKFWKPSYLRSLQAYDGLVFLEGPFPKFLESFLGIERIPDQKPSKRGELIPQEPLRSFIREGFKETLRGTSKIEIVPKVVQTKPTELARDELFTYQEAGADIQDQARRAALSLLLALKNRYKGQQHFAPNRLSHALAVLCWTRCLQKMHLGSYRNRNLAWLHEVLQTTDHQITSLQGQGDSQELLLKTIWIAVLAEASHLFPDSPWKQQAAELLNDVRTLERSKRLAPLTRAWLLYASSLLSPDLSPLVQAAEEVIPRLPQSSRSLPVLWVLTQLLRETVSRGQPHESLENLLKRTLSVWAWESKRAILPPAYEGLQTWELLLIASLFHQHGEEEIAQKLMRFCTEICFDIERGAYRRGKIVRGKWVAEAGYQTSPWIVLALQDFVLEFRVEEAGERASSEYTEEQIAAWAKAPYWIEPYRNVGGVDEATVLTEHGEQAGLFRRGRIVGTTFQLLSYLVHFHTMHPLKEPFYDCPTRHILVLEQLLLHVLRSQLDRFDRHAMVVHSWPWKRKYCLTIRHDVDRILSEAEFERLLQYEKEKNLGVSWYWLPHRMNLDHIYRLERANHEIGLHALRMKTKKQELETIEKVLNLQERVYGETWHGGGSDRWVGHPSVRLAVELGLSYTEFGPAIYNLPFSEFPYISAHGLIHREPQGIGISLTASTDVGMGKTEKQKLASNLHIAKEWAERGFYICLLNHPDLNFDALVRWVDELSEVGNQVNWTCSQVAAWWKATHQRRNLTIEKHQDSVDAVRYQLVAQYPVQDLELRYLCSAAGVSSVSIRRGQGKPLEAEWEPLSESEGQGIRIRLDLQPQEQVEVIIHRARPPRYEEVYAAVPSDVQGPNVEPNYHLPRVNNMVQVIQRFTPFKELQGVCVADIGCGYGPFTIALHILEKPRVSIGLDLSSRYVEIANDLVDQLGLANIRFVEGDMTKTSRFVQHVDILIVNNSINFLRTRYLYKQALRSFWDALAPGGVLVILTPNRLYYREAFTQLVGVQFMPKFLANWYVRFRKKCDTYEDIRLPSPIELWRWLQRIGFQNIQIVDAYRFQTQGWRRFFKPRFYLVAWKPHYAK